MIDFWFSKIFVALRVVQFYAADFKDIYIVQDTLSKPLCFNQMERKDLEIKPLL